MHNNNIIYKCIKYINILLLLLINNNIYMSYKLYSKMFI